MKITVQNGIVKIETGSIAYANVQDMYQFGSGQGLQISENLEHKRGEIISLCGDIADKIYELKRIIGE